MKRTLFILTLCLAMSACTGDQDDIRRILETDGCTEIELLGWSAFGCADQDTFSCKFQAKKNGRAVTGVVCGGVLKGKTIRYF